MPKIVKALSAVEVKRLAGQAVSYNKYCPVGGVAGLQLQVVPTGASSWVLRTTVHGKRRHIGLGGYPDVDLKSARERARNIKDQIFEGNDPVAHKRRKLADAKLERASRVTFAVAAARCHEMRSPEFKNEKHKKQWIGTLEAHAFPIIGDLPVGEITVQHLLQVLQPIWRQKTETANRLRQRIEVVMNWSRVQGFTHGENPARWKGNLKELLPSPDKIKTVRHHKALPWREMPEFMRFLRAQSAASTEALTFLILTGARSKEVRLATWNEIDFEQGRWTVPAEKMKAGREHVVPLSCAAIELLSRQGRCINTDLIFPSSRFVPLSDNTLSKFLRDACIPAVPHGFRSSFKDWARSCTTFADEVSELALAHVNSNATRAAYARDMLLDKRAEMMEQWAEFLSSAPPCESSTK